MEQWITAKDIAELTSVCLPKARYIIKVVNDELVAQGCIVPSKHRAPKSLVYRKLGLKGENK
jgi:hypothetical protein